MTEANLLQNGFKKVIVDDNYYFELKVKNHTFITNDTIRNNRTDNWFIGYANDSMDDHFWFNKKLINDAEFKIIFHVLTGIEFKLAHQRNLINKKP